MPYLRQRPLFYVRVFFLSGQAGITDQWKYRIQQALFRYSGEMYMPGLLYAGNPEKEGAGEWVRKGACLDASCKLCGRSYSREGDCGR